MMTSFSFFLTYLLIKVFSHLPISVLNRFASFLFVLMNHIVHYRRNVIDGNLRRVFPDKDAPWIRQVRSDFYRYFSRLIVENLKLFALNLKGLQAYVHFENPELIHQLYEESKSVAAIAAHYGNWEFLLALKNTIPHHTIGIYKKLNNKRYDRFFKANRSGFGTEMVCMREVPRVLMKYRDQNKPVLSLFIADQSPVWEEIQYWTPFLNQQTPVYLGPEKLARKMGMAVIYFRVRVEKGNRYSVKAVLITKNAATLPDKDITEKHLSLLEEDIYNAPQYWLWSHRRWKLTDKREFEEENQRFRFEGQYKRK